MEKTELVQKISELEAEIERLKGELATDRNETDKECGQDRRSFMKAVVGGAAGLGAISMLPSAAGFTIRSPESFRFYRSGEDEFSIGTDGTANVTALTVDTTVSANAIDGNVSGNTRITNLAGVNMTVDDNGNLGVPAVDNLTTRISDLEARVSSLEDGSNSSSGGDDNISSALYADFEDDNWQFWTDVYRDGNVNRVQSPVHEGNYAMQVFYPSGSQYGATLTYEPVVAGDTSSAYQEMYVRYWVYFPTNFQFANQASKLPGPWSTKGDPTAGNPSNGSNGWSCRGSYENGGNGMVNLGYYTYHMDMSSSYGEYFGMEPFAMGEWHRIDQYVRKNTISNGSANYDGAMHMWVDGQQIVNENSMRFSTDTSTGIDFRMAFFFGGDNPAPQGQSIYTDNYRIDNVDFAGMHN